MLRSISTKLLVAVIAAVALPLAGFAFVIEDRVADKLMLELVRESLKALAADLAEQVDGEWTERRRDVAAWAAEPVAHWALEEQAADPTAGAGSAAGWGPAQVAAQARRGPGGAEAAGANLFRAAQTRSFDRYLELESDVDALLLVDLEGRLVACNSRDALGRPLDLATLGARFARDWSQEGWFRPALDAGRAEVDQHPLPGRAGSSDPADYRVGFAHAVDAYLRPGERAGVLYASVRWTAFQKLVDSRVIQDAFRGLVASGEVPSPYAWIWAADGDTILAHRDPALYGTTVSSLGLGAMVEDALAGDWGLYREYEFRGEQKNAAYKHALEPELGGLGWIIGVGIDNRDIYAATTDLRRELFHVTVAVLLVSVLLVLVVARRTTGPILALERHTRRVAEGDLEARLSIPSRDEVGRLAAAFNAMTADLARQREQLVRAEKDAAWREMARQIAHDIKNPLTPIQLSLDLLDRSRVDGAADRDEILARTTAMMRRQVEALRGIAQEFYDFTGGRPGEPATVDLCRLLAEVYDLHRAWAAEERVELALEGCGDGPRTVWADREKLRRVLTNLVSNAIQAMPDGGRLEGRVLSADGGARVELRDTGVGLDPEVRAHLFEPRFTTKSEGTGLGLAISRRVVDEAGGWITLEQAPDDGRGGALASVWLPGPASAAGGHAPEDGHGAGSSPR